MAALNRLSQRIIENFQETTRDLSLLTGNGPSTTPYDLSDDRLKEISTLLDSRIERERLEGMKRIIAGISKGRDMEGFFAQVVKNVVSPSIEIRKLVYIYLLRFASTNSDLLLLSINTFQKDLSDPSPLIRSMSLRVLTSIRVPVIQGIVMLGLKKLVTDRNPWVRKTVAGGLAKVYEMDSSSLPQLIPLLQTLLSSPSPLTLGATLTAFTEICPDRLDLLHPYYRHIIKLLVDADEWGQSVALSVLTRYARVMLEQPPNSDGESEDEFSGIDEDLAMFLHFIKPLFQSRNPAVVLATANAYYHLAPSSHTIIGQDLLVKPLLRLAGSSSDRRVGKEAVGALTWEVLASMAEQRPWLFKKHHESFLLHSADSTFIQESKLRALIALVDKENAQVSLREFKHYIRFPETSTAEEAVRALGYIVRSQPEVAASGLRSLMKLLKSQRDTLVAQAVIVLKSVILSTSLGSALPSPQKLVAKLARQLDGITNPKARASVYWLVGQFAAAEPSTESEKKGLGWEGVELWVPDILRKGIKGFTDEASQSKLQIITLASKLLVLSPSSSQLNLMSTYLFSLARYDSDYDVRDRARFLHALLRGVRDDKVPTTNGREQDTASDEDEEDRGGVVLRREQVKVVLLGKREIGSSVETRIASDYQVGSMSRITGKKLNGYEDLPEWTDDPTDSSLRDSEFEDPQPPTQLPAPISNYPIPPSGASNVAVSRQGVSPAASSPAGSYPRNMTLSLNPNNVTATAAKGKFQDLDAFLNSESESDEEKDSESDDAPQPPRAVTAPPRSAIVPEYDEDTSEEESEEEQSDDDSESEDDERAALYR
uniref:AP-3 complex subunit beta n=1 Tax=Kwoniella dejecticola CBS 10117 TaxID=1296121 RepID=A0A1A6AA26_9TREE|nr:AP-3 complex subunit beta [Kwoniella dejecticola CBS 10117]OBR86907.1 AP-3 complex subunit beta [Kwoniella dejecticola CBS 10117]